MSITPKKFDPVPLKPGCVIKIFVPTTAMVGGVQNPLVVGDNGTFPDVTPLIVMNEFVATLYANGSSNPALRPLDTIPYATLPMTV